MKILAALLASYCLLLPTAQAEVTEYDFEIIIFEDTSGRYASKEQWQHELAETDSSPDAAQRNPGNSSNKSEEIDITPIKGIGLNKYARKLKSNKRYNVLVHKAWRQTGLAEEAAIDIPIDSRKINSKTGTTTTSPAEANNIHGTIKIVLGRYLHIYTDMVYQQPLQDEVPEYLDEIVAQHKEYPINFHRRMRSKELHYLDHPLVGILVMAMPVKKQEEPKEAT